MSPPGSSRGISPSRDPQLNPSSEVPSATRGNVVTGWGIRCGHLWGCGYSADHTQHPGDEVRKQEVWLMCFRVVSLMQTFSDG